jgi:hypothetical protein
VIFHPWLGGEAQLAVNYDSVTYDNVYTSFHQARGMGGTVTFNQDLGHYLQLNVSAGVRAPFNAYQAGISYIGLIPSGDLSVGLIGNYTEGKACLPNTSMAGIEVSYTCGSRRIAPRCCLPSNRSCPLTGWTEKPAVYMPQVLARADQALLTTTTSPCPLPPPAFIGGFVDLELPGPLFITVDTASSFSGTNLTFSATNLPPDLNINPVTGLISGIAQVSGINIVVTATNICGSAQSNAFNIFVMPA